MAVSQKRTALISKLFQPFDDDLSTHSEGFYRGQNSPPVSEMTRYGSMDHIQQQQQHQRRVSSIPQHRKYSQQPQNVVTPFVATSNDEMSPTPNPDKVDIIPMSMDKPSGLPLNDFLPRKFQNLNLAPQPSPDNSSKFSAYKSYCQQPNELSEAEVTSSIIKGHDSMMTVLASRGRNLEIIQKLWQSKDAKTGMAKLGRFAYQKRLFARSSLIGFESIY